MEKRIVFDNRNIKRNCGNLWEVDKDGNVYKNGNEYKFNYDGRKSFAGIKLHIAVAKAFPEICGVWYKGCDVHHIDHDVNNNKAENLIVMTKEEHRKYHASSEITLSKQHLSHPKGFANQKLSESLKEYYKTHDGSMKGKHLSDETKEKLSKIFKGCKNEKNKGANNWMYGKHPTNAIKVYQYTLDKQFIKEWPSIGYVARTLKISNIVRVCKGQSKSAGGYFWSYTKI